VEHVERSTIRHFFFDSSSGASSSLFFGLSGRRWHLRAQRLALAGSEWLAGKTACELL
jgi:hypothetical protein